MIGLTRLSDDMSLILHPGVGSTDVEARFTTSGAQPHIAKRSGHTVNLHAQQIGLPTLDSIEDGSDGNALYADVDLSQGRDKGRGAQFVERWRRSVGVDF